MIIRSFESAFELADYTQELTSIPNQWGLINELGIFTNEPVTQHSVTVESLDGTLSLVTDQPRGTRNKVGTRDKAKLFSFAMPHFPLDDYLTPQDLQGKRAYGTPAAADTLDNAIAKKLLRIRQAHAVTLETARAFAITSGAVYAPNGTVVGDYYSSFGITKKVIDFVLGTATTDLMAKTEEGIAHIQDNILDGSVVNDVVVLCSPTWFAKLIAHPTLKEAYKYYTSTQEPLRKRLGSGRFRRFEHGGVTYIEYRGSYNGAPLIPAGKAYMLPTGTADTFVSYFGPANKFDLVNTLGEEAYVFTYRDGKGSEIEVQSEHNAIHLLRRPQAVVELITSN